MPLVALVLTVVLVVAACTEESPTHPDTDGAERAGVMVTPRLAVHRSPPDLPFVSVFITYKEDAPSDRLLSIIDSGARMAGEVPIVGPRVIATVFPRGAVQKLLNIPWIDSIGFGNDDAFPMSETTPWGVASIGADDVHGSPLNNKGNGVKVAVLDNGMRCTHSDLSARVVGGYDYVDGDSDYCHNSTGDHGTPVAGIIGASENDAYVIGVAPEVDLYSVRVCSATGCPDSWIILGLQWAIDNDMDAINLSLGNCGDNPGLYLLIAFWGVHSMDIPVVASAGNGIHTYPVPCDPTDPVSGMARLQQTIGVSAHTSNGVYRSGYQYGPGIDVSAPTYVLTDNVYGGTSTFGGTSAAAPHVTGTIALLLAEGFPQDPDLLKQRIRETALDKSDTTHYGQGLLRADDAVVAKPKVTDITGVSSPITTAGTHNLTAQISDGAGTIQVRWDIDYSDPNIPDVHTWYGSATYGMSVPIGAYNITVKATPREQTYLRVGWLRQETYVVCTVQGSAPMLIARTQPSGRPWDEEEGVGRRRQLPDGPQRAKWSCDPGPPDP